MPKEITWWVWLATALLLVVGLTGHPVGFVAAILLSVMQSGFFRAKHRSWMPYAVQIRMAYTALLVVSLLPPLRWLYWLPTVGTFALLFFGYCLMARVLSLMPWNRVEPINAQLLLRTFLAPPVIGRADHGLPPSGCPGGVCELEAHVAQRPASLR